MLYVPPMENPSATTTTPSRPQSRAPRILEYELAQGWIVDDRGAQVASVQPVAVQSVQPAVPVQRDHDLRPCSHRCCFHDDQRCSGPSAASAAAPTTSERCRRSGWGKKRPGPRLPSAVAPPTAAVTPTPPPGQRGGAGGTGSQLLRWPPPWWCR